MQQRGFVRAGTREDALREQAASAQKHHPPESPQITGLNSLLDRIWMRNSEHMRDIRRQMLDNLRARNSEYSAEKRTQITSEGGSPVYMGITEVKCNHGEAWLNDIFSSTQWSWALEPTPVPDLTPFVRERAVQTAIELLQERAAEGEELAPEELAALSEDIETAVEESTSDELWSRAKGMERKIQDQFEQGGFHEAFADFTRNLVALKAGIIKGPVIRSFEKIDWEEQEDGSMVPTIEEDERPEYYSVSPFDFYPDPDVKDLQKGNLVETYQLSRSELGARKGDDNYDEKAINRVLSAFEQMPSRLDMLTSEERDRRELEDKQTGLAMKDSDEQSDIRDCLKVQEFWTTSQGRILKAHGRKVDDTGAMLEDLVEYEINVMRIGSEIIFLEFNPDPLNRRPYSVSGWSAVPGSFWYRGVPERMADLQQICNAATRALVSNLGLASGPQVEIDTDRLPPGETIESIFPHKIWQTVTPRTSAAPAIRFFQPNSNAQELISIYEKYAQLADDYTGIPAYAFGSDKVAGAGRTSSGLSMLMSNSAKGIKRVILDIDMRVMRTLVQRQFDWNMQFIDDPSVKGDMQIVTTGTVALMAKEQMASRRMEFLNATNNETDLQLVGLENRAHLLRETGSTLEMEGDKVVKSAEEIRDLVRQQESQQAEQSAQMSELEQQQIQAELQKTSAEAQLKQAQAASEQAKIQLEQQKLQILQMEVQIKQFKAESDAESKGTTAQAALTKASSEATIKGMDALKGLGDAEETEFIGPEGAGPVQGQ